MGLLVFTPPAFSMTQETIHAPSDLEMLLVITLMILKKNLHEINLSIEARDPGDKKKIQNSYLNKDLIVLNKYKIILEKLRDEFDKEILKQTKNAWYNDFKEQYTKNLSIFANSSKSNLSHKIHLILSSLNQENESFRSFFFINLNLSPNEIRAFLNKAIPILLLFNQSKLKTFYSSNTKNDPHLDPFSMAVLVHLKNHSYLINGSSGGFKH